MSFTPAVAQETITYSYDALGRLVAVGHSGNVNNGISSAYTYDPSGNRTNVTVSGIPTCVGVSFAVGAASANEGGNAGFTVSKSGATTDTCSVNYATADGTAKSGTNYTAKSGSLSFAAGTTSQAVTIGTIDDHVVTGDLAMYLNLSSPSGSATITTAQGTGTIHNIDTNSSITIQLASGSNENLRTIANNNGYTGSSTANYTFVVGTGVTITGTAGLSSGPGGAAIDTGSWPAGVTLALTVNGIVRGGGGGGGSGGGVLGTMVVSPNPGGGGGDAIQCHAPISITIQSGAAVQAGGGGGGGAGWVGIGQGGPISGFDTVVAGGGGGGGAPNGAGGSGGTGYDTGTGSPGSAGTTSGGGAGGASPYPGGAGGTYGTAGTAGQSEMAAGASGGPAGYAVRKNGTTCTVTGAGTITGTVG